MDTDTYFINICPTYPCRCVLMPLMMKASHGNPRITSLPGMFRTFMATYLKATKADLLQ